MQVEIKSVFGPEELLSRLRETRLKGHGQPQIYKEAHLQLVEQLPTNLLMPAQRYVLSPILHRTLRLREAILACEQRIDIFGLRGGLWVSVDGGPDEMPVIPPIIEESFEGGGSSVNLINDGLHRVFSARSLGLPINVVLATGVPQEYPYYSYPLSGGWDDVEVLDDLDAGYEKKSYREPNDHKALFRDFNAVFAGVQPKRKQTGLGRIQ